MGIDGLTLAKVSEALHTIYLKSLRYQLNDKASVLLAQLDKGSEGVSGKEIAMALRYGRVGGIGNRADDADLPTPNARKTKQAKWETRNTFARFSITDKTIKAARDNRGAFANLLTQEVDDCQTDAKLDVSRQALGDGVGQLCKVATGTNDDGDVVVVTDDSTTQYLAPGMLVDVFDGVTKKVTAKEIIGVTDHETFVLGETAHGDVNAGYFVYVSGNKDIELTGLEAVIAEDTTLYGIDRSEAKYKWLNAVVSSSVGTLAEVDIQTGIDNVETFAGGETNFILCSKGVNRAFYNLQRAMKQHVNTLDLKGGWKALSYSGGTQPIALVADKYVLPGVMYGLDLADWKMYQMGEWEWLDKDGSMFERITNKAAYEATLVKYHDIGCQKPKGQFKLTGITEL